MRSNFQSDCRFLKPNDQTKSTLAQNCKKDVIQSQRRNKIVKFLTFALGGEFCTFGQPGREAEESASHHEIAKKQRENKRKEDSRALKSESALLSGVVSSNNCVFLFNF